LQNGDQLRARLVVGSDGSDSIVKKDASISSIGWDYPQRAVVANVRCEQAHNTAWQRFLPNGPVALLPLHDNFSNIVWSTTPEHAKYLCSLNDQQFLKDLNSAFRADSSGFQPGGRRSMFDCVISDPLSTNSSTFSNASKSIPYSMLIPILFPSPKESTPPLAIESVGKRASFPLRMIHSETYIGSRCVLIGKLLDSPL
jgi:ubiquinone biosynthesis monooxygenase Coq6